MPHSHFLQKNLVVMLGLILAAVPAQAKKKKVPTFRWTAGAPGCQFQRTDDGRYRWRLVADNLDITVLMDSQELTKSRRRFYQPLGVYLSVTYTGRDKFDFQENLTMQFPRHHNVVEGYLDPTEFTTRLQNDMDTHVFETEHKIKKNPETTEAKTTREQELQKEVAEFIEFLSTQSLEPAILTPGNPEAHGWVFFPTRNKWLGSWKEREDFILRVLMTDKVYEFPFSMPPEEGELILRKRDE
jgi:hypothetical protein